MKRFLTILILIALIGTLAACSPPASEPTDTLPPHEAPEATPEEAVAFADPVLEAMVRGAMGRPEGDITVAEAEAVTRLNLSIEWQRYIPEETPIQGIGGLEYFKNLESLDLSFHAITDITPLAGLQKLTVLSLAGNPVADIAPLAGLTNLKVLTLSGCAAQDYSPLAKLVDLKFLMLDNSTIADVSPLASLTKLKHLYLTGSPINNYFPLSDIYQNLEQKDFTIAFTLAELGFTMNDANNQASYGDVQRDGLSVNINHAEWGAPQSEDMTKCVRMDLMLDSGYTLVVLYYPEISAYVFQMNINGEQMNYIYDEAAGGLNLNPSDRESFERMITDALGETDTEDILLAPIPIFNNTIQNTFGMTADALYALPFEHDLPFVPDYTSEDEINPYGVASGNYYNGGGVYGEWQNGLLTSQGSWVYYAVPAEGYAICKMRTGGGNAQRLGEENGCCLNVVGDWLYYCNLNENNRIFKMRTDGSERTQVSDDACKYMAVCGEWIVYADMNENDSLYMMRLDGSERTLVAQSAVQYPYLYNGRIYFQLRDERSFYSIAPDGSDMQLLVPYVEGYCIEGDWVYYITDDNGMVVAKMRPDGSAQAVVFRFEGKGGFAFFSGSRLIVSDIPAGGGNDQVLAVDPETMEKTVLVDDWCEAFYIADGIGYYLNYEEGNVWYYVDLTSGEIGRLEQRG